MRSKLEQEPRLYLKKAETFFLLFLTLVAFILRMPQLGKLGLWGDEGFTGVSVSSILEHGYPLLPSGGIYLRAFLLSYIEAFSAKLFGLNEFSLRFPSLLFGLAVILMTYVLAKRLHGIRVACLAASLVTFSIWEITFSRYARMYTTFQFFYLLSVYCFYRGFIEGERLYRHLTVVMWVLTLSVHQIAVSLAALFAIPFFIKDYTIVKKWTLILSGLGFIVTWKIYTTFTSFLRGTLPPAPSASILGSPGIGGIPIGLPPMRLFLSIANGTPFLFYSILVLFLLGILMLLKKCYSEKYKPMQSLFIIITTAACFFNQIGLAFLFLFLYSLLFFQNPKSWRHPPFRLACIMTSMSLTAWLVYGTLQGLGLKKIIGLLFQFPYLNERFIKFFVPGWPWVTLLMSIGLFMSWLYFIRDRRKTMCLFSLSAFLAPLVMISLVQREDDAARYSFHLYPLMLILVSFALVVLLRHFFQGKNLNIATGSVLLFLLILPSDFELSYAVLMTKKDHTDLIEKTYQSPGSGRGYTFHPDYKSPAQHIKNRLTQEDVVISMVEAISLFYIGQLDYLWIPKEDDKKKIRSVGFTGKVPRIHFSDLLDLLPQLTAQNIWLLKDPIPMNKIKRNTAILAFMKDLEPCQVHLGKDQQTSAYHFRWVSSGKPICIS